jgi:small subunit ribosomal protein S10
MVITQKNTDVNIIRITLSSYDYKLLEKVLHDCIQAINLSGGHYKGPVFLPKRKHLTTFLTSPHVYKTALEQYELITYKSLIDVYCGQNTLSSLSELNINSGVEIKMNIKQKQRDTKHV